MFWSSPLIGCWQIVVLVSVLDMMLGSLATYLPILCGGLLRIGDLASPPSCEWL